VNALAMVRRCGQHQGGERASAWATRETVSSEAPYTPTVSAYVPEEAMGGVTRPIEDGDTTVWE
jgi:hypothetical protein